MVERVRWMKCEVGYWVAWHGAKCILLMLISVVVLCRACVIRQIQATALPKRRRYRCLCQHQQLGA